MKLAVVDTGVFVSGVFWRAEPHRVLRGWLRGVILPVVSEPMFEEYERVLQRVKAEQNFTTDLSSWVDELRATALWVQGVPLGKKVCRDASDDKFIEAALAAQCRTVIARDPDLTVLEKPFGISMLTPRGWLSRLSRAERALLR